MNASSQLLFEPNYPAARQRAGGDGVPLRLPGGLLPATGAGQTDAYGWIHSPEPQATSGGSPVQFDTAALTYLQNINHNPLDTGDNLSIPSTGWGTQTWWGFPTWRETLSYLWERPDGQVNVVQRQPNGLAGRRGQRDPLRTVALTVPSGNDRRVPEHPAALQRRLRQQHPSSSRHQAALTDSGNRIAGKTTW